MSQTYVSNELRLMVRQRAAEACEYCLIPEAHSFFPHEIDHITAQQHGGETVESNLALACLLCNKHKGTNLTSIDPESGQIVPLFNPRRERWVDHFRFQDERVETLTAQGRATARLLQFNTTSRIVERKALIAAGVYRAS